MGEFQKETSEDYGSLKETSEGNLLERGKSFPPFGDSLRKSGDWTGKNQGNTGKNLVEKPYRKPTQVGRCGRHSGLRRTNTKELGQFAP